jgi:hypothetical protein
LKYIDITYLAKHELQVLIRILFCPFTNTLLDKIGNISILKKL